jgi:hypothetical protein
MNKGSDRSTLALEVGDRAAVTRRALEAFKGHARDARLSFAAPEHLFRLLTTKRWEILLAIFPRLRVKITLSQNGETAPVSIPGSPSPPRLRAARCGGAAGDDRVILPTALQLYFADGVSAIRSLARCFRLALLSWPQAAMMSRPRGVLTGEA